MPERYDEAMIIGLQWGRRFTPGSAGQPVNCCPLLELAAIMMRAANAAQPERWTEFSHA